jgi:23S rRNA (guanosine2251-2'-O)-methyltransferase
LDFEARWSTFTQPLILVVDGVTDPRNLGACMRSAGAADVDAVLIPKRSNAPLSNVVRKTASGALEDLLIVQVSNLARRIDWLRERGVWIVGTDVESIHAYTDVDYRDPVAIVVGGEQRGLRRLTREKCDHLVTIPMRGPVSSLNVSVATGILLFECLRQRGA